ncbi:MAG: hypothetical protein QM697_17710 [Lachnospiraceae bacterium]
MELDLLHEYKELYYKEIEFKDSMSNKIGTSITFLTILCTGHMYMWNIMVDLQLILHIIPITFLLLEIVSVYFTGLSIYNFYKSYYKYKYYLVSAEKINQSLEDNNSLLGLYKQEEIDIANYNMMCNTFYTYTNLNRKENIRKNTNQTRLGSSLIKALLTLVCTYTMYIFIINKMTF